MEIQEKEIQITTLKRDFNTISSFRSFIRQESMVNLLRY